MSFSQPYSHAFHGLLSEVSSQRLQERRKNVFRQSSNCSLVHNLKITTGGVFGSVTPGVTNFSLTIWLSMNEVMIILI